VEGHVVETDLAAHRLRQCARLRRRDDAGGFLQQFADPAHATSGALQLVPDLCQRADRSAAEQRIQHELAKRAGAHAAVDHVVRARPQHHRDRAEDRGEWRRR
jgi:hypothetical protein